MAYFTAVIARSGRGWKARDVEVDDASSLDELTDALRSASIDEQPVLAVIEHEDEWFALVRVDSEEEPRLFVSDLGASSRSHYGELLASAADVDVEEDVEPVTPVESDDDEDELEENDEDAAEQDEPEVVIAAWAGDPELLDDLGISARVLRKLVEENGDDPGAVLAELGESVGFAELLEALR
ncbi:MAG TPA: tRNA adenosine deaminase-associated protein [Kineosporiaceae bacterium]|nr:tRNA adenosine deaminase-associated protein [Kineosporiaceae bacterium]